jgi:hypothetical protein
MRGELLSPYPPAPPDLGASHPANPARDGDARRGGLQRRRHPRSAEILSRLLPNQIQPSYNIRFSLPNAAHVLIAVFDTHAERVKILLDDDEPATLPGSFRNPPVAWDFTDAQGNRVPSGDYRVYFRSGDFLSSSDVAVE